MTTTTLRIPKGLMEGEREGICQLQNRFVHPSTLDFRITNLICNHLCDNLTVSLVLTNTLAF